MAKTYDAEKHIRLLMQMEALTQLLGKVLR